MLPYSSFSSGWLVTLCSKPNDREPTCVTRSPAGTFHPALCRASLSTGRHTTSYVMDLPSEDISPARCFYTAVVTQIDRHVLPSLTQFDSVYYNYTWRVLADDYFALASSQQTTTRTRAPVRYRPVLPQPPRRSSTQIIRRAYTRTTFQPFLLLRKYPSHSSRQIPMLGIGYHRCG